MFLMLMKCLIFPQYVRRADRNGAAMFDSLFSLWSKFIKFLNDRFLFLNVFIQLVIT